MPTPERQRRKQKPSPESPRDFSEAIADLRQQLQLAPDHNLLSDALPIDFTNDNARQVFKAIEASIEQYRVQYKGLLKQTDESSRMLSMLFTKLKKNFQYLCKFCAVFGTDQYGYYFDKQPSLEALYKSFGNLPAELSQVMPPNLEVPHKSVYWLFAHYSNFLCYLARQLRRCEWSWITEYQKELKQEQNGFLVVTIGASPERNRRRQRGNYDYVSQSKPINTASLLAVLGTKLSQKSALQPTRLDSYIKATETTCTKRSICTLTTPNNKRARLDNKSEDRNQDDSFSASMAAMARDIISDLKAGTGNGNASKDFNVELDNALTS